MARFDTRELGSFDQDVATLAGSLVHEVKNPLSTLNINAQLLLEEYAHPASQREQRVKQRLGVMADEVGRIEAIVNNFVRFTQPQDMKRTRVQLEEFLPDLLARHDATFEQADIRVLFNAEEGLPALDADPSLLHQAFLNLLQNAQHAMPDGGELLVRCQLRDDAVHGDALEVEVIDTGEGIPEDRLPRIFRPYYSTKGDGTGLGLPTTLRIIRAHGGHIRIESEAGKGSRFVVSLPLVAPEDRGAA